MAKPNTADFALLEVFSAGEYIILCGIEGVTINRTVNTSETFKRDCAAPNRPGTRKLRTTGITFSISGTGFDNIDLEQEYSDAFGVRSNWRIRLYRDDGSDSGELMGSYTYSGMLTVRNQSYSQDDSGTVEITIEGEGSLDWQSGSIPINALLSPIDGSVLLSPVDGEILLEPN